MQRVRRSRRAVSCRTLVLARPDPVPISAERQQHARRAATSPTQVADGSSHGVQRMSRRRRTAPPSTTNPTRYAATTRAACPPPTSASTPGVSRARAERGHQRAGVRAGQPLLQLRRPSPAAARRAARAGSARRAATPGRARSAARRRAAATASSTPNAVHIVAISQPAPMPRSEVGDRRPVHRLRPRRAAMTRARRRADARTSRAPRRARRRRATTQLAAVAPQPRRALGQHGLPGAPAVLAADRRARRGSA